MATSDRGRNQMSRRELLSSGLLAVPVTAALIMLRPVRNGFARDVPR